MFVTSQVAGKEEISSEPVELTAYPTVAPTISANAETVSNKDGGDTITYTITATNFMPKTTDIVVTADLDTNLDFQEANNDGKHEYGTVTWTLSGVASDETKTVTMTVKTNSLGDADSIDVSVSAALNYHSDWYDTTETLSADSSIPVEGSVPDYGGTEQNPVYVFSAFDNVAVKNIAGVEMKLEGKVVTESSTETTTTWTSAAEAKMLKLVAGEEYTLTVDSTNPNYQRYYDYSVTFVAGVEYTELYGVTIKPMVLDGDITVPNTYDVLLDMALSDSADIPQLGGEEIGTTVTINIVNRENQPMAASGTLSALSLEGYVKNSNIDPEAPTEPVALTFIGAFSDKSVLTLDNLADGIYSFVITDVAEKDKGYVVSSGTVDFCVYNGEVVTEDTPYETSDGTATLNAPYSNSAIIVENSATATGFSLVPPYCKVTFDVSLPGSYIAFDWVVKNSSDVEVASSETDGAKYLEPGTYTLYIVENESTTEHADSINFPAANEGVAFTVDADYNITIAEDSPVAGRVDEYSSDDKWVIMLLTAKSEKTVTANIVVTGAIEDGYIYLETTDGDSIFEEELPAVSDATHTATWTVPTMRYDNENENWVEISYKVTGYYYDSDGNYYDINFTEAADNVFTGYANAAGGEEPTTYPVNISADLAHGKITADVTEAKEGDTVTLTVTPDDGYKLKENSLAVTDADGYDVATRTTYAAETVYYFDMPASTVDVTADFELDTIFTVAADAGKTTDVDTAVDGVQVYAGDTVTVEVIVKGGAFTNADWTLLYDSSKFALAADGVQLHESATEVQTNNDSELAGQILGANAPTSGNEYAEDTVVATYTFTAIAQSAEEVPATFRITSAHTNNYAMAGDLNNCPAHQGEAVVTILQVTDTEGGDTGEKPSGSIGDTTANYSGLAQAGEAYTLNPSYANATVTYAAEPNGAQVADPSTLTYRTARPTWTEVGTYYYYVKVSGDGLAVIYDEATLTIQPRPVEPTVEFAVDPEVGDNAVTITPVITNVVDNSFKGTVTVTGGEGENTFTQTIDASTFTYDGESSAYGAPFTVNAPTSGEFVVNITYTANVAGDNYADGRGTASVEVDKITAEDTIVNDLKSKITNEFIYNAQAHSVTVDEANLPTGWVLGGITDAFTDGAAPSVTNVGEEVLAKVVFEDTTGVYNDVVVYVVLSVTPAKVTVTIGDFTKAMGDADPADFSAGMTMEVELADGTTQSTLFGDDDLQLDYTRAEGEIPGDYAIDASYVPDNNYDVTIVPGTLTISAFTIDDEPTADILVEVVDTSKIVEGRPDYIAGKRLILVYTNVDKAYFAYGDETNGYAKMYDVTNAGYQYVDNQYADDGTLTQVTDTENTYDHVYGIIVDTIDTYVASEDYEAQYVAKVKYMESDEAYRPERIVYDADINMSETEVDVNDYSMTVGIYNGLAEYDITTNTREDMDNALKADYTKDKLVDSSDALGVKGVAVR